MTTRPRDETESSVVGVRRTSPTLDHVHNPGRDTATSNIPGDESAKRTGSTPRSIGIAAGFLFVMAVIGSAAALAWRTHADLPLIAELQREDMQRVEAATQRLELMQQELAQHVDALQQLQQKSEQSRLADVQRLSERLTSLQAELEKKAGSGSKEAGQKRKSSAAAKDQPLVLDTAQQSSGRASAKLPN